MQRRAARAVFRRGNLSTLFCTFFSLEIACGRRRVLVLRPWPRVLRRFSVLSAHNESHIFFCFFVLGKSKHLQNQYEYIL